MDRSNEDDAIKNSGSFLLRSTFEEAEDSALNEKRPLMREDMQFDDFKPNHVLSGR